MEHNGKIIILIGLGIVLIGIVFYFFGDKFSWVGHLPGDFRIDKGNFKLYFPLTTMLILSLFLNIVLKLIKWFLH